MHTTTRPAHAELPALLLPLLREHFGPAPATQVLDWRPAPRGFSTETILFDVGQAGRPATPLVLRRPPELALFPDYDLLRQVLVMRRLAGSGIPVPTVHWLDRSGDLAGTPYYVMDRLEGDAPGDFPSYHSTGLYHEATPEQRARMWFGCVDVMADLHRLDWQELDLGFLSLPQYGEGPLEQVVNYLDAALRWAVDSPPASLTRAVGWLRDNLYEPEHLALCWGDARLSNVLYDQNFEVTGVLDWEIAYLGDHEADLAWLLFLDWASSEHEGIDRLPGTPSREETIAHYERRSGLPVRNLRYNEVLAALLLSVPLLRITTAFSLPPETIEVCTRRIDELIDGAGCSRAAARPRSPRR